MMTAEKFMEDLWAAAQPLTMPSGDKVPVAIVFHPDGETISIACSIGLERRHVPMKLNPRKPEMMCKAIADSRECLARALGCR